MSSPTKMASPLGCYSDNVSSALDLQLPLERETHVLLAQEWARIDPHAFTRAQVEDLTQAEAAGDSAAAQELHRLFSSSIRFGTAGMRGVMEAGSAGLNYVTALRMAQGTCDMLLQEAAREGRTAADVSVVVGYDHRSNADNGINSKSIAATIAAAFVSRGVRVHMFANFCHTPLVPFTVVSLSAAAGIMVTASHNPKLDNGIKVYNASGCQSSSLECERIQQHMEQNASPWPDVDYSAAEAVLARHAALLPQQPLLQQMQQLYIDAIHRSLSRFPASTNTRDGVPIVYTAMHGVGYPFIQAAFHAFGLPPPIPVPLQVQPDPTFPTVKLPNPEEGAGALQLSFATAQLSGARLVVASDPDADRFVFAELQEGEGAGWRVFNGNEIGLIFAHWMLIKARAEGEARGCAVVATVVSSVAVGKMAQIEGFEFHQTATGFKNIGSKGLELKKQGKRVLLCYEEAIGFSCGEDSFDKDGVSAAAVFGELAHWVYSNGHTLLQHLLGLRQKYGHFAQANGFKTSPSTATTQALFDDLRAKINENASQGRMPPAFADHEVESWWDATRGVGSGPRIAAGPALPVTADCNHVIFWTRQGAVVSIRASGTEPKIKHYIEFADDSSADAAQEVCDRLKNAVLQQVFQQQRFKLL